MSTDRKQTFADDAREVAMTAVRKTRMFWAGSNFNVPHDAVESFTQGIVSAVVEALTPIIERDYVSKQSVLAVADAWDNSFIGTPQELLTRLRALAGGS